MSMEEIRSLIVLGSGQLGVSLSDGQVDLLVEYLALLKKWNKAYNLTAIRDQKAMVSLHILDSLAVIPSITAKAWVNPRFIDVGTGAGLPGMVMAIVLRDCHVTLLDSNGKKCRFLTQVKTELGLTNVEVIHDRVEKYSTESRYDGIFSRAFATLKDMTDNAAHLLGANGRFWAMKGQYPQDEIASLDEQFALESVAVLTVPMLDADRHLIELSMS